MIKQQFEENLTEKVKHAQVYYSSICVFVRAVRLEAFGPAVPSGISLVLGI